MPSELNSAISERPPSPLDRHVTAAATTRHAGSAAGDASPVDAWRVYLAIERRGARPKVPQVGADAEQTLQ